MKKEMLLDKACDLTDIATQLGVAERLLECLEYSRVSGDMYPVHHQVNTGVLGCIRETITNVKEAIQAVSNDNCPDEM